MFTMNSYKLSIVLLILYCLTALTAVSLVSSPNTAVMIGVALGFVVATSLKGLAAAVVIWFACRKSIPFFTILNIAIATHMMSQVLGDIFMMVKS